MSKLKGTNIASPIVPYTDSDIYPTHFAKYGHGGYRTVQNYEELINLPESRLEEGMLVYLVDEYHGHNFYQYKDGSWEISDIENSNVLDFYNPEDRNYDVKVEGNVIKVRNELGEKVVEETPIPGQFNYLKINSFYLGQYGRPSVSIDKKHDFLPCSHTFIELANISNEDASLNGLYLLTFNGTDWNRLKLTGVIPANSTYLIRGEQCSVINSDTTYIKILEFNQEWLVKDSIRVLNNNGFTAYLCWCTEDEKIIGSNNELINYPETYNDIYSSNPSYIDCVSIGNNNRFATGGKNIEDTDSLSKVSEKIFVRRYPMDPAYVDTKDCRIDWRWHFITDNQYRPAATYEKKNLDWGTSWMRYDKPLTLTCTVGESVHINTQLPDGTTKPASRCFTWVSHGLNDEYLFIRPIGESSWAHFGSLHGASRSTMVTNYVRESVAGGGWIKATDSISLNTDTAVIKYYNRCQWETYSGEVLTTHRTIAFCDTAGEYEYCSGKITKEGNPDPEFVTNIQTIKIYETSDAPTETITIGNQFIGNQEDGECWWTVSNKIFESIQDETIKEPALVICTGNMVNNGNRPGEWVTYINNDVLHYHYAEFITPGTNDFGGENLYKLYGPNDKISPVMFSLFFTFEQSNKPNLCLTIPSGVYKDTSNYYLGKVVVPGFYVSYFGNFALCSLNSAITTLTAGKKSTIQDIYSMVGEELTNEVPWSIVHYGEKRSEVEINSSIFFRRVMNWFVNNFAYYLDGSTDLRDLDDTSSLYTWFLNKFSDIYGRQLSYLVKARRFIVLTNYPPVSPVENTILERRKLDSPDRMGNNLQKDNLNARLFFGLSRLFKCLNIHYVIGSSSFASTLISRPIFDAQGENGRSITPFDVLVNMGGPINANRAIIDDQSNNLFSSDTFHPVIQCTDEDTLFAITENGFRKLINDTRSVVMNVNPRKTYIGDQDGILDAYFIKPAEAATDYSSFPGLIAVVAPIYLLLGTSTTKYSIDNNSFANIHASLLGGGLPLNDVHVYYGTGGWFNSANTIGDNCTPTAFLIDFGLDETFYPNSSELTEDVNVKLLRFDIFPKVSSANDYKLRSYWNTEVRRLSDDGVLDILVSENIPMSSVNSN